MIPTIADNLMARPALDMAMNHSAHTKSDFLHETPTPRNQHHKHLFPTQGHIDLASRAEHRPMTGSLAFFCTRRREWCVFFLFLVHINAPYQRTPFGRPALRFVRQMLKIWFKI